MSVNHSARTGDPQPLVEPSMTKWPAIVADTDRLITDSHCVVAGQPLHRLRALARREALELAQTFSARAELPSVAAHHPAPERPLIVTGHQPILCSTGVWSKYFALSLLAERTSGIGLDLVIDSDRAAPIAVDVPSLGARPGIKSIVLSPARAKECFAAVPPPSQPQVESFAEEVLSAIRQLPLSRAGSNFETFLSALTTALPLAANIAELMSFARRHFEAMAGLHYLQLPVTDFCATLSFRSFVADILARADEFADVYNRELQVFRVNHKVRSAAQPVPDLRRDVAALEIPFWLLVGGVRRRAFVRRSGGAIEIISDEGDGYVVSANTDELQHQLEYVRLVPKALTLTMFTRLFLADMFIHGIGGARYDSVTDAIIRRFYGLEAPHFAVVSVSAAPPFAIEDSGLQPDISRTEDHLKMLKYHPEIAIQTRLADPERAGARDLELVSQKRSIISEMSRPGADKAILGEQMRHVNERLRESLQDDVSAAEEELTRLRARAKQVAILGDRRYPYCFFNPNEYKRMFARAVL